MSARDFQLTVVTLFQPIRRASSRNSASDRRLAKGYTGGFATDLMLEDLGLATDAAKQAKQSVIMGGMAQQLYQLFSAQGGGALDFSAIIHLATNSNELKPWR
jgi:3-hydroxyisobutyrate dehydrogenase-like beta-hydroxyacid dehydrogenase